MKEKKNFRDKARFFTQCSKFESLVGIIERFTDQILCICRFRYAKFLLSISSRTEVFNLR